MVGCLFFDLKITTNLQCAKLYDNFKLLADKYTQKRVVR